MRPIHLLAALAALMVLTGSAFAEATKIRVTGLGIFGNLDMQRRIAFLSGAYAEETFQMDARELEDTAFIIIQQLKKDGYPVPEVEASVIFRDGRELTRLWTIPFESLAREKLDWGEIESVRFACNRGRLNFYDTVEVRGVQAIDPKTVVKFFLPSGTLFTRKEDLAFTESNLQARISSLLGALRHKGYMQASVESKDVQIDKDSGRVAIKLTIHEGPLNRVGSITINSFDNGELFQEVPSGDQRGKLFNYDWLRSFRQKILNKEYSAGYPDASLKVERSLEVSPDDAGVVHVNLAYTLQRGQKVRLTGIQFQPESILKQSILNRTVELRVDQPFDLLAVEEGRRNLLSLGMLKDVDLQQIDVAQDERIASYTMSPLPRQTLLLRAGWGSYEQARVGLRYERLNLWQRAHRYDFELEISTKSAKADLTYIIPHFFDQRVTAYAKTGHEFREEISYDRTTTSFLLGASRRFEKRDIELSLEYSLERQTADRGEVPTFRSADQATVSSLSVRGILDRRDSVLYPTTGYDLTMESKTALEAFGGNANFQKIELSGSYHRIQFDTLHIHLSLRYGGIFSRSPASENLPFNERFFLGGENTIRGYQQGEASPVDPNGQLTGAESYILGNVELEQRLFSNLSVVVFWDTLLQSARRENIPDNENLNSMGLGIRLRTPIGPVRLEYGHNLSPRPGDPDGTLHVAVGYPF